MVKRKKYLIAIVVILFSFWTFWRKSTSLFGDKQDPSHHIDILHISYVHYLDKGKIEAENFFVFMHFAYVPCDPHVHFTITLNADEETLDAHRKYLFDDFLGGDLADQVRQCSHERHNQRLTSKNNTVIIWRKNIRGGDLCAHVELIKSPEWHKGMYRYFAFINSSSRGPFMPKYWLRKWWYFFIDIFKAYERTVLVGPVLSCEITPHIQSWFVAVDSRGMDILEETWRCPKEYESRYTWVAETEVRLGTEVIKAGYEMRSCLMRIYDGLIEQMVKTGKASKELRCFPLNPFKDRDTLNEHPIVFELPWYKNAGLMSPGTEHSRLYVPYFTKSMYESKGIAYNNKKLLRYLDTIHKEKKVLN